MAKANLHCADLKGADFEQCTEKFTATRENYSRLVKNVVRHELDVLFP